MRAAHRDRVHVVAPAALAAVVVVAFLAGDDAYHALVTEDGPLEWAQFVGFAAAAWWFGGRAVRRRAVVPALFATGFVVVAGEEVAWGQRLFDLRVDAVQDVNAQGELTLHNIGRGLELSWMAFAGLALLGALGPVVLRRLPARWQGAVADVVPTPSLRWWFVPAAAYAAARVLIDDPGYSFAKAGEYFELCVAVGFSLTAMARAERPQKLLVARRLS